MRYILDNVHPDYIVILKYIFEHQEVLVKDFRLDKDLSFLRSDDCLVLSMASIINNYYLFSNLRQSFICFTANRLPNHVYLEIGKKKNCKGFICSSIENQNMLSSLNLKSFLAPNIYPDISNNINLDFDSVLVSSFINNYQFIANENPFDNINSYEQFKYIKDNYKNIELFDQETEQKAKDVDVLIKSKYCLHIKYWGHVCNAPLKSLALGVPVIMDSITYNLGCYSYYLKSGFNSIIVNTKEEIVELLNNKIYDNLYNNLKVNCLNSRNKFIDKYSDLFYFNLKNFLNE